MIKAENDLKTAVQTIKLGDESPSDTICFHAQQCVEKYVKALLVLLQIDFPKTHDLEELIGLLPERKRPSLTQDEQSELTEYATGARLSGLGRYSALRRSPRNPYRSANPERD